MDAASTPEKREELMNDLLGKFEQVRIPMRTAHSFGVEEIIDPRDTRPLACEVGSLRCFESTLTADIWASLLFIYLVGGTCICTCVTTNCHLEAGEVWV